MVSYILSYVLLVTPGSVSQIGHQADRLCCLDLDAACRLYRALVDMLPLVYVLVQKVVFVLLHLARESQ